MLVSTHRVYVILAAILLSAGPHSYQISWCKLEASVSSPKDVSPVGDSAPEPPPLTVMSLSLRTVLNHQENNREIVCVSGRIWRDGMCY